MEGRDGFTITIFFQHTRVGHETSYTPIKIQNELNYVYAQFRHFLSKTKIKAYTKLTVVMCSQIVARKSVAQSIGDFGGYQRRSTPEDKIRNLKKKKF